jgi:hypothetical protein
MYANKSSFNLEEKATVIVKSIQQISESKNGVPELYDQKISSTYPEGGCGRDQTTSYKSYQVNSLGNVTKTTANLTINNCLNPILEPRQTQAYICNNHI